MFLHFECRSIVLQNCSEWCTTNLYVNAPARVCVRASRWSAPIPSYSYYFWQGNVNHTILHMVYYRKAYLQKQPCSMPLCKKFRFYKTVFWKRTLWFSLWFSFSLYEQLSSVVLPSEVNSLLPWEPRMISPPSGTSVRNSRTDTDFLRALFLTLQLKCWDLNSSNNALPCKRCEDVPKLPCTHGNWMSRHGQLHTTEEQFWLAHAAWHSVWFEFSSAKSGIKSTVFQKHHNFTWTFQNSNNNIEFSAKYDMVLLSAQSILFKHWHCPASSNPHRSCLMIKICRFCFILLTYRKCCLVDCDLLLRKVTRCQYHTLSLKWRDALFCQSSCLGNSKTNIQKIATPCPLIAYFAMHMGEFLTMVCVRVPMCVT